MPILALLPISFNYEKPRIRQTFSAAKNCSANECEWVRMTAMDFQVYFLSKYTPRKDIIIIFPNKKIPCFHAVLCILLFETFFARSLKACNQISFSVLHYRQPTKLQEGNVFSRVCLSLCPQGGVLMWSLPWCIRPHCTDSWLWPWPLPPLRPLTWDMGSSH